MKTTKKLLIALALLLATVSVMTSCRFLGSGQMILYSESDEYDGYGVVMNMDYAGKVPTELVIPDSHFGTPVVEIFTYAFAYHSEFVSVTIPDGVIDIGLGAFKECTSLKKIYIPASVTIIDVDAFCLCDSLTDVYYGGSEEEWAAITIDSGNDELINATIHYNNVQFYK